MFINREHRLHRISLFGQMLILFIFVSCQKNSAPPIELGSERSSVPATIIILPYFSTLDYLPNDINPYFIIPGQRKDSILAFLGRRMNKVDERRICITSNSSQYHELKRDIKSCVEQYEKYFVSHKIQIENLYMERLEDQFIELGGKLREKLSLTTGLGKEAKLFNNKNAMKKRLQQYPEIKSARWFYLKSKDVTSDLSNSNELDELLRNNDANHWNKIVIKPTTGHSSNGVKIFPNTESGKKKILTYLKQLSLSVDSFLLEEYLEGDVYRLDGITDESGNLLINFTSRYLNTPMDFYQNKVAQLTTSIINNEEKEKFEHFAQTVLQAFNPKGPYHLEVIVKDNEIYFLEIAARIGGTLSRLFASIGTDFTKAYIYSQFQKFNEVTIGENQYAYAAVVLDPPNNNLNYNHIWVKKIDHTPFCNLKYFQNSISNIPIEENGHLRGKSTRLVEAFFVGDMEDKKEVFKEARIFYTSLKAKIKSKRGPNYDQWINYKNNNWNFSQ